MAMPFCIICLKKIDPCEYTEEYLEREKFKAKGFPRLIERYLKIDNWIKNDFKFCYDCSRISNSFCAIYQDIERMKLQLQWKLGTLENIMFTASRVPSRIFALHKYYSGNGNFSKIVEVEEWRQKIIKKSLKKLSNRFPRVKLSKLTSTSIDPAKRKKSKGNLELASLVNLANEVAERLAHVVSTASTLQVPTSSTQAADGIAEHNSNDGEGEISETDTEQNVEAEPVVLEDIEIKTEDSSTPNDPQGDVDNENNLSTDEGHNSSAPCIINCFTVDTTSPRLRSHFRCLKCWKTFSTEESLAKHEESHPDEESFPVSLSDDDSSEFLPGMEDNSSGCDDEADDAMTSEMELSVRQEFHCSYKPKRKKMKSKSRTCGKCGKEFQGDFGLNLHMMRIHNEKPNSNKNRGGYACSQCEKVFIGKNHLQLHLQARHPDQDRRKFECSKCEKKCSTQKKLDEHSKIHEKENVYKCDSCGARFQHKRHWKRHIKFMHERKKSKSTNQRIEENGTSESCEIRVKQERM